MSVESANRIIPEPAIRVKEAPVPYTIARMTEEDLPFARELLSQWYKEQYECQELQEYIEFVHDSISDPNGKKAMFIAKLENGTPWAIMGWQDGLDQDIYNRLVTEGCLDQSVPSEAIRQPRCFYTDRDHLHQLIEDPKARIEQVSSVFYEIIKLADTDKPQQHLPLVCTSSERRQKAFGIYEKGFENYPVTIKRENNGRIIEFRIFIQREY